MLIDRVLCFRWKCYGDADCDVSVSFHVVALCTPEEFLVRDIYGIQCSGFEFKDGRPGLMWDDHTRMCDQFCAVFKVCYAEDVAGLQADVQNKAREIIGPTCLKALNRPPMPAERIAELTSRETP